MILTPSIDTRIQSYIWDLDRDTGVEVERAADDDILYLVTAGVDVFKGTSSLLEFNPDNGAIDLAVHGADDNNLVYFDAVNNTVGFNTALPFWNRQGKIRYSKVLAVKPDLAGWNAYAQAGYFVDAARTVDVSMARARGTELAPTSVFSGDGISNLVFEGHDGKYFVPAAGIKIEVDGTVSADDVPGSMKLQTGVGGILTSNITMRSDKLNGVNENNPNSTWEINGSFAGKVNNISSSTYQTDHDYIIGCNTADYTPTVTLSTADRVQGRIQIVKDRSGNATANNIKIDTEGATNIDGAASINISTDWGWKVVYCGGSHWFVIGSN